MSSSVIQGPWLMNGDVMSVATGPVAHAFYVFGRKRRREARNDLRGATIAPVPVCRSHGSDVQRLRHRCRRRTRGHTQCRIHDLEARRTRPECDPCALRNRRDNRFRQIVAPERGSPSADGHGEPLAARRSPRSSTMPRPGPSTFDRYVSAILRRRCKAPRVPRGSCQRCPRDLVFGKQVAAGIGHAERTSHFPSERRASCRSPPPKP